MTAIRHVVVRGRVQGVGFRAFVEDEAARRGLSGWVRNHRDGSVEALFAGDVAVIADMIGACRRGPPGSRIDAIEERDGSADQLAMARNAAFTVLPTA